MIYKGDEKYIFHEETDFVLLKGECLEVMRSMPDNCIDSIVTDPPYGISFMTKKWDYKIPSVEEWEEALRVLKPGGHMLAFGGTRTYHRVVVNIEDAGFEIRDTILWLYGSGFPKSLDVSKAIDKSAGIEPVDLGESPNWRESKRDREKDGKLEVRGENAGRITAPVTNAAIEWDGWGTALKPAYEPICVARKPFSGSVAENVLKHGTGGLNIDACRIEVDLKESNHRKPSIDFNNKANIYSGKRGGRPIENLSSKGRWPANLILDEEAGAELDRQSGDLHSGKLTAEQQENGGFKGAVNCYGDAACGGSLNFEANSGGASRFFYCAKASQYDRDEGLDKETNKHPTVKPTDLMQYLVRLVTPLGGIILDQYMGSGSTGKGALRESFKFIGIDNDAENLPLSKARIKAPAQVELL